MDLMVTRAQDPYSNVIVCIVLIKMILIMALLQLLFIVYQTHVYKSMKVFLF